MEENGILRNIAIFFVAGMVGMIVLFGVAGATGMVHNINTGLNYDTIQSAIDNASTGDEIHVDSGTYYENVVVNKRIVLRGIGNPTVTANRSGSVITLNANSVILAGFTVAESNLSDIANCANAGIKVGASNSTIINNIVRLNKNGITLLYNSNNTLMDNNISDNDFGICLINSNNNTVKNNNISNKVYGVVLDNSRNNSIENNIINLNDYAGISLGGSSNYNIINTNIITNSNHAIVLSGWYNQFIGNTIKGRSDGFFISSGYNNTIKENNISFSYYSIYSDGSYNKIYHNNFVNITNVAYGVHGTDEWDNNYPSGGNYWDSYTGVDANNDGIGDTPIVIPCNALFCQQAAQDRYPLMAPYTVEAVDVIDYWAFGSFEQNPTFYGVVWSLGNGHSDTLESFTYNVKNVGGASICYSRNYVLSIFSDSNYQNQIGDAMSIGTSACDLPEVDGASANITFPLSSGITFNPEYYYKLYITFGSGTANPIKGFKLGGIDGSCTNLAFEGYPAGYRPYLKTEPNIAICNVSTFTPNKPTELSQLKADGTTPISVAGTTNERTVVFQGRVSDSDGHNVKLQVELRRTDENNGQFNESLGGLKESELVSNDSIVTVSAIELINGGYHWRARTVDANGNKGEWQDFGDNLISEADFTVQSEDFRFAHVTDTHLGYYVDLLGLNGENSAMEKSVTDFTDILQNTKDKNIDFIVVTGDLVQHREPEFFMAFTNLSRGFTVYATPGNHDRRLLLWGNDPTNYKNIVSDKLNPVVSGEADWSFSHKGYNFIGLDSGADYNIQEIPTNLGMLAFMLYFGMTPESNGLAETQWDKLNTGGFSQDSQRQVIFMHSPIMNGKDDEERGDEFYPPVQSDWPGGNDESISHHRGDLINYAINNRVDLVLTGHTHRDAVFNAAGEPDSETSANRPLFIQTRYNAYRIIEVNDGRATPLVSEAPQQLKRKSSAVSFSTIYRAKYGLHAYDSQRRHTGMVGCTDDFELGIPDSYYTGNYQGTSVKPEVIVGYSPDTEINSGFTEYKILSLCVGNKNFGAKAVKSAESLENITFNQTITDQTDNFTTEITFYNVALEQNSSATVNISNATNYVMEVDLTSDGIVDQVVIPDSVSTQISQPQSNISIVPYTGTGTINITASLGNISSAGNMNVSMFPEKESYEFPVGLIAVNISGLNNGSIVNLTIALPENISASAQYWEYGKTANNANSRWYRIPFENEGSDNIITIELQDGGAGDDDGIENGIILSTGGPGINSGAGIDGAVIDSISKTGIVGASVSINASVSTVADLFGFYSLIVPEGEYNLTAKLEPTHYANSSVQVSTIGVPITEQDIELVKKPTGTITGSVRNS